MRRRLGRELEHIRRRLWWLGEFSACIFLIIAAAAAAERPNILWLTSEDNGPHLGCYGDDYAVTPNLDALAARGLRFLNASSNAPVCAPARTTIISGLFAPSAGAGHMRSEVRLPDGLRMFPQYLREAGYYCTNNSKEDYNLEKPGRVWDESSGKAHWRNRRAGQPFFAVFNHTISHESQIRNHIPKRNRIHDPARVRLPAYHPDAPEVRKDWAQYYDRLTMMDRQVGDRLRELVEEGLDGETIVFYFSDHGSGMPRNKRWLYMTGLRVPMIAVFPAKWRHLAPEGYEAAGESDRLVSFVDLAPTMLSLAGIEPPAWMQGGAFAGEFAADEPQYSYGYRGRMDERYDLARSVRDKRYNYIRNYMPHRIYGQHLAYMFQTPTTVAWRRLFDEGRLNAAQAKFWKAKPTEELYDLQSDPEEIHNLAGQNEYRDVLVRMRREHAAWEQRARDVGLLPEWEMRERSRGSTPYELARDPRRYDFDAVFAAAQLATSGDAGDLPRIVRLLSHEDSGVRYWAATGLLAHRDAGVSAGYEELLAALNDESPIVQITAAEALGRYGSQPDAARALDVLIRYIEPEGDYYLAVAAWNAVDYLDDRALPIVEKLRAASTQWNDVPQRLGDYTIRLKAKTLADLE